MPAVDHVDDVQPGDLRRAQRDLQDSDSTQGPAQQIPTTGGRPATFFVTDQAQHRLLIHVHAW